LRSFGPRCPVQSRCSVARRAVGRCRRLVGLVHQDGDVVPPCPGMRAWRRSPESDEHVGRTRSRFFPVACPRRAQPPGTASSLVRHRAVQRHGGDEFKVIARNGSQAGLNGSVECRYMSPGGCCPPSARVGERKSRLDIPATLRQQHHPHYALLIFARFLTSRRWSSYSRAASLCVASLERGHRGRGRYGHSLVAPGSRVRTT